MEERNSKQVVDMKNILINFIVISCLLFSGCVGSDDEGTTDEKEVIQPIDYSKLNFTESLAIELGETPYVDDSISIDYNNSTKEIVMEIKQAAWSTESYRRSMFFNTIYIMPVLMKHQDMIDNVTIIGYTYMIDVHGNKELTKAYMVQTTIEEATKTNWENLMYISTDYVELIENNFETVYWHPSALE
jgi:hypothetical protein